MKDGHIHTPYCPHGTDDKFEQYESSKYVEINKDEWNKLKVSSAPSFNVRFEDLFNSITIN